MNVQTSDHFHKTESNHDLASHQETLHSMSEEADVCSNLVASGE